jgi:integrase
MEAGGISAFPEAINRRGEWEMTALSQIVALSALSDPVETELSKDLWDVRNIPGVRFIAHHSNYLLNFTCIPLSFRAVTKRYIRWSLIQHAQKDCYRRLRYIQIFLEFFLARYPEVETLRSLSRADMEAYLFYLNGLKGTRNRWGKKIGDEHVYRSVNVLKLFLEYLERIDSPQAPSLTTGKLIWPADGGKLPQINYDEVKCLPETILLQLEACMHNLPSQYLPVVALLRAAGWRISDVLNLRYDTCLEQTSSGFWLCGDIPKTDVLHHKVPISHEIATLVKAQVIVVREKFSEQENPQHYLFPALTKRRMGYPLTSQSVQDALNRLSVQFHIKDEAGSIFHFGTHAFRHTKGVELINNGMSLIHVQKWFAHLTPEMTLAYAKLLDSTKRKEWEQAFAKGAVRIDLEGRPQVVNTEQLENEQEIEWEHIRHNLDAVRLADGYCFKPKKANCPTQDSPCYTCRHFCTTPDFLPQFDKQERELHELIELGKRAGSEIWVERNTQKLNRVLPVIQVLRKGDLHHPAGKAMREYTPAERAKRA